MSENNPWKKVGTYVADICLDDGDLIDVDVCLRTEVDAARAAEATQHQQEIAAKDETIRQIEMEVGLWNQWGQHNPQTLQASKLTAEITTLRAERDRLKAALQDVTIGMDRAGGDRDGMPECPWCQSQGRPEDAEEGYAHDVDCSLMMARAALTPQGQSTDGETR